MLSSEFYYIVAVENVPHISDRQEVPWTVTFSDLDVSVLIERTRGTSREFKDISFLPRFCLFRRIPAWTPTFVEMIPETKNDGENGCMNKTNIHAAS